MAWIEYLSDGDSSDSGDNILRIHSVHKAVGRQHLALYQQLMRGPGPLTRVQREMIGVVVSAENQCLY